MDINDLEDLNRNCTRKSWSLVTTDNGDKVFRGCKSPCGCDETLDRIETRKHREDLFRAMMFFIIFLNVMAFFYVSGELLIYFVSK